MSLGIVYELKKFELGMKIFSWIAALQTCNILYFLD